MNIDSDIGELDDTEIIKLARQHLDQGLCFDRSAHITRATDAELIDFARKVLKRATISGMWAAVRYRIGNTELLEALMLFIEGNHHEAAMESASGILTRSGMRRNDDGSLDWDALKARQARDDRFLEQITWEEAVKLCITDPMVRERLLALADDATMDQVHAALKGA